MPHPTPKSNFTFLTGTWAFLDEDATKAEQYALSDPRTAAIYGRRALELGMKWIFKNDASINDPYETNLAQMLTNHVFRKQVPKGLYEDLHFLRKVGNLAAHDHKEIPREYGVGISKALHAYLGWLTRVYTKGGMQPPAFDKTLLPKPQGEQNAAIFAVVKKKVDAAQEAERKAQEAHKKLSASEEEIATLKAQLATLQAVKETNVKTIRSYEYSESQTRELIVDIMLREAGWDPKGKNVEEYKVVGMPTESKVGFVDYVLWGKDGKPLALIEAKKTKVDPKQGERQAEIYAGCLEAQFGQRPIIYYSNGYKTWKWDDTFYPPREVQGFSTLDELQWSINRRKQRKQLATVQPNTDITGRPYQIEAIGRVMETYEERKRKALLVMATGTGKTRVSISIVDMLLRAGWVRKVLFLADRTALVKQAKKNFANLLPHVTCSNFLEDKTGDARILFSTYPTMLNCLDGTRKDQKGKFSSGHFDLIIIDEAHRSIYQKYKAIFEYFDALLLGMTATPRSEDNRQTYEMFGLPDKEPTYFYELDKAVEQGFLVPPRAISVPLKFQREGIKYSELSDTQKEEYENQEAFYDEETGELKEEIGSPALNKWLFNKDTIDKVLAHLMENGIKVGGGDTVGKTIIFAKNTKHADYIVERFDANYPAHAGKFCRKIDFSVKHAQSLIDNFELEQADPQIVVSVDMMDTGIDASKIVNLVFFKIVRSSTKFWQMVGRGTRLHENLFGHGQDKKEFVIFDYCQNLEFFDATPEGYDAPTQEPLKQRLFKRRLDLISSLEENNQGDELGDILKGQLHSVVNAMNHENFIIRGQLQAVEAFSNRERWSKLKEVDYNILSEKLSGLPSHDEDNEAARRFDLIILNLQLALLKNSSAQNGYIQKLKVIASGLEEKETVPTVKAEIELIQELSGDEFWQDVTLPMLEDVRVRLRNLIRLVDTQDVQEIVYTNFTDELLPDGQEFEIVKPDATMEEYHKKVQRLVEENKDHITIRRLKNNEPISRADIIALEKILFSDNDETSREHYNAQYGDKPLGLLVRSITGLDKKAAQSVFAEFLSKSTLHPDQIRFLDQIISYLVKNGTMEPAAMFDSPFNNLHDQGIDGLFNEQEQSNVFAIIKRVTQNASIDNDEDGAAKTG